MLVRKMLKLFIIMVAIEIIAFLNPNEHNKKKRTKSTHPDVNIPIRIECTT